MSNVLFGMKNRNTIVRILLIALSIAGIIIMAYLTYLHYVPTPPDGSVCDIGEGLSCDVVNKSAYSEIFGIPMSVLGILYFILVATLSIWRYNIQTLSFIALFLIVLLGPSLYLSVVSKAVLENICIFCETSKVIMAGLVLLSLYGASISQVRVQRIWIAVALAITLAAVTYFVHSWTITEPFTYSGNLQLWELFK
ncbi:hypothetical protein CL630_03955 [bacterium]|nr:hypothetical protein [bacterium]|tara:strand:- start:72618 stop:73205 length:588 start_codon:yes stop_codon:yes gene_type:complete